MKTLGRHRVALLLAVAFVLAVASAIAFNRGETRTTVALDPDNPGPGGARAVAHVLADHGIEVTVVRSADELDAIDVSGTTVVVTSTEYLGAGTAARLRQHAAYADLVLTEPPAEVSALDVPEGTWVQLADPRAADCTDDQLTDLEIQVTFATEYPTPQGCFGGDHGFVVATPAERVTVLGAGQLLTNDQILRADNAAAALRLLGQHERLVWYVANPADLAPQDGAGIGRFLPRWLTPAGWLVGVAVIGLMLWRGRRLGPLAVEPLPVVVKAIETTQARGRLYRKVNDRAHAAEALRAAARSRLAERLHLPATTAQQPEALVRAVAAHTNHPSERIAGLIGPAAPPPRNDHELISLANALAQLDREVRRP